MVRKSRSKASSRQSPEVDIIPNSTLGALEELQVQLNDLNKEENADLVAAWEKDPDYGRWYYILQNRPTIRKIKFIGDYMGKHFQ